MYLHFISELEKIAEEKKESTPKRTTMQTISDVAPWIMGFAAGNVAGAMLKEHIGKVKNPTLKTIAKIGVPLAGGALSYLVLPKLQAKWKESLLGQKPKE